MFLNVDRILTTIFLVLIMGSFFPCIYYGFFCEPTYQVIYLSGLTIMGAGKRCSGNTVFVHSIIIFLFRCRIHCFKPRIPQTIPQGSTYNRVHSTRPLWCYPNYTCTLFTRLQQALLRDGVQMGISRGRIVYRWCPSIVSTFVLSGLPESYMTLLPF